MGGDHNNVSKRFLLGKKDRSFEPVRISFWGRIFLKRMSSIGANQNCSMCIQFDWLECFVHTLIAI